MPDGPPEFHPEFGCSVGTFTTRNAEMDYKQYQSFKCLMFHVPVQFRGAYYPDQLANYDPDEDYSLTPDGHRNCESIANRRNFDQCRRPAKNRQPYCESHGAKLHPLDKIEDVLTRVKDPALMSRLELLDNGYIDVEDLTDDELRNGVGIVGNRVRLSKETFNKICQRHFKRAQDLMNEGLLPAIQALNHIAQGTAYEPADRLKAITYIIDRTMGKTPEILVTAQSKEPWQQLVNGISPMTREESRRVRTERDLPGGVPREEEIVEAEVVPEEPDSPPHHNAFSRPDGNRNARVSSKIVSAEEIRQESGYSAPDTSYKREIKPETAKSKRYTMRKAGRSSVENVPIEFGSDAADRAAKVTLGDPGADEVS